MTDNTENKSELLSEETVYEAKYFRIKRKEIARNGKTFTKDFIERNPVVLIIPYTDNEIYIASEFRDAFGKTMLNLIGGKLDKEEDILEAAKRELQEEAGLSAASWKQIASLELSVTMDSKVYVFAATQLAQETTNLEEDEVLEIEKLQIDEALTKIEEGVIVDASDIASLLLFDRLRKEGKI